MKKTTILAAVFAAAAVAILGAQQIIGDPSKSQAQLAQPTIYMIPISATNAVNNQTTLTIPAPSPGLYNYICKLDYNASQNGTATAQTNAVITSTNFGSLTTLWGWKYSLTATATINYDRTWDFGTPATGCAKSIASGTATTFVSPAAGANIAFTLSGAYYQGL